MQFDAFGRPRYQPWMQHKAGLWRRLQVQYLSGLPDGSSARVQMNWETGDKARDDGVLFNAWDRSSATLAARRVVADRNRLNRDRLAARRAASNRDRSRHDTEFAMTTKQVQGIHLPPCGRPSAPEVQFDDGGRPRYSWWMRHEAGLWRQLQVEYLTGLPDGSPAHLQTDWETGDKARDERVLRNAWDRSSATLAAHRIVSDRKTSGSKVRVRPSFH